jgi:hypothetical protein
MAPGYEARGVLAHTMGQRPSATNDANARLIASAPELYEALTDCRKVFSGYAGIHRMKLANPELGESDRLGIDAKVARNDAMADMCERALAKARGAA